MNERVGTVGGEEHLQALGPGFDPQVPHISFYFFLQHDYVPDMS